jgi:hypothetical protein
MKKLVLILGLSGVGKSTATKYLEDKYAIKRITPTLPLKEHLEYVYDLPKGWLHTQTGKIEVINAKTGYTVGKIIFDLFDFYRQRDPEYGANMLIRQLTLNKHPIISVEGIRTLQEARIIDTFCQTYAYELIVINLVKPEHQGLDTDRYYDDICDYYLEGDGMYDKWYDLYIKDNNYTDAKDCLDQAVLEFDNKFKRFWRKLRW